MSDKSGKLATLIVIGVLVLPLLGLLIMDYQLSKANDITGAYLSEGTAAYAYENMVAGITVMGMMLVTVLALIVVKVRHSKMISTTPLAKINAEIKSIDSKLDKKIHM